MFALTVHQRRDIDFGVSLFQAGGQEPVAIASDDVVRLKLGTLPGAPLLVLSSDGLAPGGSMIEVESLDPAVAGLHFKHADLDLPAGTYDAEIVVLDAQADLAPKHVEQGTIHILPSFTA